MLGHFASIQRQLSTRRLAQNPSFINRGLEEFFEKGQRLPKERDQTGRAWEASELRQKSWEDLQKLWYVVLKERNLLASQKEEARRLGVANQFFSNKSRIIKCKKTMARIKSVLGEREIAWRKAQAVQVPESANSLAKGGSEAKVAGAIESKNAVGQGSSAETVEKVVA